MFLREWSRAERANPKRKKMDAHHWSTRGAVAKQAIVDAFKRLPEEPEAAEE
ncbi:hypothetical protein GOC74_00990 [Halomicrobium mukohataei]|uniref:Uncharacterized protein n=1 Tax=Halomicrobium mukohataei TaxID=57705 RepID=A0A847TR43_9EURY|nr:hypothetical protein [Halomicrobium mukohataei]NLV08512.1 hypothetical protein [Halomicrobium mukohataei]